MLDPYAVNTTIRALDGADSTIARRNAFDERNVLVGELAAKGAEKASAPFTRRRMALFGAAFALATAAFAGVMLTSPPTSEAARLDGISVQDLHARAPLDLGSAETGHEN